MKRSFLLRSPSLITLAALVVIMAGSVQARTQRSGSTSGGITSLRVGVSPTHWRLARLGGVPIRPSWSYFLDGVACPGPAFCLLAGYADAWPSPASTSIVERYDGHRWARLHVGLPSDTFTAVSCATPTYCMVVGTNAESRPLAELYGAGHWTRYVVQHTNNQLAAVACPRVGTCIVAGTPSGYSNVPVMSWELSGGRWHWVPVVFRFKALYAVSAISCVNARGCELVGGYTYGGPAGAGVIERFDGTAWRPDEVQTSSRGGFDSVSCVASGLCVATEDMPWAVNDANGLSGFVAQEREQGRWAFLGRGLPAPDQLVVAAAGAHCFHQGWCVVTAASDTGMFVGAVVDGQLSPLAVVRGVRLPRSNPWLDGLSCASPSFCVEGSQSSAAPYVLMGDAS